MVAFAGLALALALSVPHGAAEQWLFVAADGSTHHFDDRVEAAGFIAAGPTVRATWAWSGRSAPRRFDATALDGELPELAADPPRLAVVVSGLPRETLAEVEILAAPARTWSEVPEESVPRWKPDATGRLSLPYRPAESWRLRAVGPAVGTWWFDLPPGSEEALLAPSAAVDLTLALTDEAGGAVAGALVQAVEAASDRLGRGREYAIAVSDETGHLAFSNLPDGTPLRLLALAPGFVPAATLAAPGSFPSRWALRRGAFVHGRLVTTGGLPVAEATVDVESQPGEGFPAAWRQRTESAPDGSWDVSGVAPGEIAVAIRSRGHADLLRHLTLEPPGLNLGDLELPPGHTVTLRVVDDLGAPVAGALIEPRAFPAMSTRRDGRVELTGVPGQRPVDLVVDAPGHLPTKETLRPPHGESAEVVLHRAYSVTGRLVDRDGRPLPQAQVRLVDCAVSEQSFVAADATLRLDLVPGRDFELVASSPTTLAAQLTLPAGEPGAVLDLGDLPLLSGVTLRGRVIRGDDATPVAGAQVSAPRDAADPLTSWFRRDLLATHSDADGAFALSGLGAQPLRVTIEAAGLAPLRLAVPAPEGDDALDLGDVEMRAGARLTVHAGGFDSEDAVARVDLAGHWREMDVIEAPFVDGTARFRHIPPGPILVTAWRGNALLCETRQTLPDATGEADVPCEARSMIVSGVVRVGGIPSGPGTLAWLPASADEQTGIVLRQRSAAGLERSTAYGEGRPQVDVAVAADGTFETPELRPGAWRVVWLDASGGASPETLDLDLPDVPRRHLTIDVPGLLILGHATDAEGEPARGARVRLLETGALVPVAEDGSFSFVGVEVGSYHLRAERAEERSDAVRVEVLAGRPPPEAHLPLAPRRPEPATRFQVLDPTGRPAPGALVVVELGGREQRLLSANADGLATLEADPPWPARLRAAALTSEGWAFSDWRAWDQVHRGTLDLRVAETGTLSIRSSDTSIDRLLTQQGWDVWWLLRRLGRLPVPDSAGLLRVVGLPPGVYRVESGRHSLTVAVRATERTEVEFQDRP